MTDLSVMEQLQASFLPEAADLLADMSEALLLLEQEPRNMDLINRVFRAMHTLKGSGATAGFRRLASFVHHVEEVFDRIRNQQMETTPDLIDAALKAADCCAIMLQMKPDSEVPLKSADDVLAAIRMFLPEPTEHASEKQNAASIADQLLRYTIHFHPNREIFFSGTDPASLLLELTDLGNVELRCNTSELIECDAFDPEQCYLKWDVSLETNQPESAVRAIFQFVEDDCGLTIEAEAADNSVPTGAADLRTIEPGESNASARSAEPSSSTSEATVGTGSQSIRVDSAKIDALMRLAGELLVARGAMPAFAERLDRDESPKAMIKEMRDAGAKDSRLASELQATVMSLRMMPARQVFQRFPRLVRDIARSLDKDIELRITGEDTELDKTVIESLGDPLTHIIRNAADHGIESKSERVRKGKPPVGSISLSAFTHGSNVVIEVKDDGKGLDAEKLKRRAIEKGLLTTAAAAAMDEEAAFKIILAAGFSTVDTVTDLSGRGVGMDAVRSSVEALHGAIQIQSKLGEGTRFRIEFRASMLVSKGILVGVSGQHLLLPMDTIGYMLKIPRSTVRTVNRQQIAHVRGAVLPLLSLAHALSLECAEDSEEEISVAVIQAASGPYGLIVDRFLGELEVVVKPLNGLLAKVPEYLGAAIMGDGKTVMVINTEKLFSLFNDTYRILYCSRSCLSGTPLEVATEVENILSWSRASNSEAGITGALLFNSAFFAQVLEGKKAAVEQTLEKIELDPRHRDLTVLMRGQIGCRDFHEWSMAFAGIKSEEHYPIIANTLNECPSDSSAAAEEILILLRDLVRQDEPAMSQSFH